MKICFLLCLLFSATAYIAQLSDQTIYGLKSGRVKNDSSYIYRLPFSTSSKFLLIQAYNSKMSHTHDLSLDFKMKKGSKVCAACEGIVENMCKDSDIGGLKEEYLNEGNHVTICHSDGSLAMYWHLKKDGAVVNVGDTYQKAS